MSSTQLAAANAPIFTLVSYVPEPLGSYLTAIRAALPDQKGGKAHLTLLPPRPLSGSVDDAFGQLQHSLKIFQSFQVGLTEVRRFENTGVVYLGVDGGQSESCLIHQELNTGVFFFAEPFEYSPHVTLAHPPPEIDADTVTLKAKKLWNDCPLPAAFELKTVDFLRQQVDGVWEKVWQASLR